MAYDGFFAVAEHFSWNTEFTFKSLSSSTHSDNKNGKTGQENGKEWKGIRGGGNIREGNIRKVRWMKEKGMEENRWEEKRSKVMSRERKGKE